ncbi:MAG TPA: cytochrome c3 family protein [Gemmatimonadales bacterium]|nr:cytochrome c3 family protein [Gemmatimonadales bacterium]
MTGRVVRVTGAGGAVVAALLAVAASGAFRSQDQQPPPADTAKYEAPVQVDTAGLPGPRQPIFFRHDIHAGQYKLDCLYCHAYADESANPGMPSVKSCMGCHLIVGADNPEVQKLREADAQGKPIEWIQVHPLAQFVRFPHMRHVVNGELECQECHGQVDRMPQVYRVASLKMGWCVGCHVTSEYKDRPGHTVTSDCSACHY